MDTNGLAATTTSPERSEGKTMRGDKIIARDGRYKPFAGRVWGLENKTVIITTEEGYELLSQGETPNTVWLMGVPLRDVFKYDADILAELEANWNTTPVLWGKAARWTKDHE